MTPHPAPPPPTSILHPRAAPEPTTSAFIIYTLTISSTLTTTTLYLGNTLPTPAPLAPSSPSSAVVIGAALGSLIAFILLLLLITCWIRSRNPDWAPYLGSSRSSFSSVYVHNPNVLPTVAAMQDLSATTRVVRDTETRSFYFARPVRTRGSEATSRGYLGSETSASSESSVSRSS